ncbi:exopolysaccharide biosynthesis polyprenyl glycosylphosphotransferase [Microvirga aerilata]|uniref:exopolysaccharide biosynthesis polyprenyl glycosylphosphotransferase n=1 Tax=Microvirga aerilata TaxID=670292 RepID=UPI00362C9351
MADSIAWIAAAAIIYIIRTMIWGHIPLYWAVYPLGLSWLFFRAASGLYPPIGTSQPEELRRSFRTTATAAVLHLVVLTGTDELTAWRIAGLALWPVLFPIAYFCRSFAKVLLLKHNLFGVPHIIIGTGPTGRQVVREMRRNAELGIIPVAAFETSTHHDSKVEGVPIVESIDAVHDFDFPYPVRHAIIALENTPRGRQRTSELAASLSKKYPYVQVLTNVADMPNLLIRPRAIGSFLILEIRRPSLLPRQRVIKRILDLAISVPVFLVATPIIAAAAIGVKIVSPGPAFFSQVREGTNGKPIRIWKIRTMVPNAEGRLAEYLAANPAAQLEYERTLKLRSDPRVIPKIGRFLRRMSIDELPQLLNVIRGDLSLVGPRVMLSHEVQRFSDRGQQLRREVPPGLTGFWQILYRNNSDIQIWESADSYYVSNWSVWLDLWIILRTVRVVLTGAGAF